MLAPTTKRPDASLLPLWNAVFCLDCEVISNSQGDDCPACKSRALVSLGRMLSGTLIAHRKQQAQQSETGLFDITITVELLQMHANEVTTVLERLTNVIAGQLARDRATFHINVKPAVDKLTSQGSLSFPEREAA